ncbi:MAG: helix-turn-helix domain-containing protein [Planctomycetota bacterium]
MDTVADFLIACGDPRVRLTVERFGRTTVAGDWYLRRRRVAEHYLVAILRGRALAADENGPQQSIGPGAVLWIGQGRAHDLIPEQRPFQMYHLRFTLSHRDRDRLMPGPDVILPQADDLQRMVDACFLEWRSALPWRETCFRARLTLLCGELLRRRGPCTAQPRTLDAMQRARLFAWLERHLPGAVHPRALIAAIGLSHDYGSRLFRGSFGMPPRTWLVHERIRRAADELVHGGETIEEIARRWGFSAPHVFSRQFRQVMGTTPSRWRAAR